jgi:hypothetical protein
VSFDPIGAALGLAPLVGEQLKAFHNRNEVRTLFGLVRDDVRKAAALPATARVAVASQVEGLRVDPRSLSSPVRRSAFEISESTPRCGSAC